MTTRRALVIGHDHVAGLGLLESVLRSSGIDLTWLTVVPADRVDSPDVDVAFPEPRAWDLVITLGAPWPRDRIRGWAAAETGFLRRAHDGGVPVLAICFGAQLLAEALGGTTRPLGRSRIGWRDVRPAAGSGLPAGPWFCWNSDQLVPPGEATVLATSDDGCEAFRLGTSVGLQFHPEMSATLLDDWFTLGVPDGLDVEHLRAVTARRERRSSAAVRQLLRAALPPRPSGRAHRDGSTRHAS
ncbi:type 1 glutamine amidotransferase [Pseudonocardia nematodicida]|uniref:Type 1 glutamine amidotransferase n=1 Tax=Pseudonocardia nematodicida TaxID=1206997 RepID=A0ABV1KH14_9PSEU